MLFPALAKGFMGIVAFHTVANHNIGAVSLIASGTCFNSSVFLSLWPHPLPAV